MGVDRHWSGKLVSGNYFHLLGARTEDRTTIEDRDAQTPLGDNAAAGITADQVVEIAHLLSGAGSKRPRHVTRRRRPAGRVKTASVPATARGQPGTRRPV